MTNEPPTDLSGSEGTTVSAVVAGYARDGFTGSFVAVTEGQLRCLTCDESSPAATVAMSALRRMEGESDPDDMVAVVALVCPRCSARGTAVLGFGPAATAEDSDVLRDLRDERDQTTGNGGVS
jgi:hypothetical protein